MMNKEQFFDLIKERSGQLGYHQLVGLEPIEVKDGYSKVALNYRNELNNPYGIIHGGVIASLIDVAIGIAVVTNLQMREKTVTADMRINYLNALQGEKGYAIGRLIRRGKNTAVGEAEVYDKNDVLVAKATGTYYIYEMDFDLWQKEVGIELN